MSILTTALSGAPLENLQSMFHRPAPRPRPEKSADDNQSAGQAVGDEVEVDDDAQLMLRVRDSGDLEAFEVLVSKYKNGVYGLVLKMLNNTADAEDVAQQVFVRVWKSARRYQAQAQFSTWLFTIARNLALNEVRRRKRHPLNSLDSATTHEDGPEKDRHEHLADPAQTNPGDAAQQREMQDAIEAAIQALPENQRTALTLWRFEDMAYEEIAQVLGTSVSSVKSLLFRARTSLRAALQDYLGE